MRNKAYEIQKRIKILRISTVPSSLSGLLKGQLFMLNGRYEVVAVSSPGKAMEILREREGVRTIAVPMERRISILKDLVSLVRLIGLFLKEQPDMVHSITPKAGLLSMLAGWITRVPVRIHTFTGLVFPTAIGMMQKLLIWMDRITCFCATIVNPEGEGVKQDLINYHITRKPLLIIANGNVNGVDLDYFHRTETICEQSKSYKNKNDFTFCFVGRIVRDKGINELVSAFVRLHEHYSQVCLLLVGAYEKELDPVSPKTEELIINHPAIHFVGFQEDVRPFLVASDVLAFPSYREGFPNVVLQAGAMGLPSIVTDINGCNEIIIPNENGIIIPPRDVDALYKAMEYCLNHPDEVKRMAANARPLIASRYDQKMVWKALLEEYEQLLASKS